MSPGFDFVCLALLVLHASWYQEVAASRPEMMPDLEEMMVQEGDDLELECYDGGSPLHFSWPNPAGSDPLFEDNGIFYKFTRRSMNRADTGWYACASFYEPIENHPEVLDHDDEFIRWIYVYVNSSEPFVSNTTFDFLAVKENSLLVLPCRTTSDKINVLCLLPTAVSGDAPMSWRFDPKIGCMVTNHTEASSGSEFLCEDQASGKQQLFMVHITAPIPPSKPRIEVNKDELLELVSGNDLHLNCTSDYQQAFTIDWTCPSKNTVGRLIQHKFADGPSDARVNHNQLTLKNITKDDEGIYMCEIKATAGNSFAVINVTLHDPENNYIVLRPQNDQTTFSVKEGEQVQWFVNVEAFPLPKFTWYDPDNNEITMHTHQRFRINNSKRTELMFQIIRADAHDRGTFRLLATNNKKTEYLNITVDVESKPVVFLNNVKSYYKPDTRARLECNVTAAPPVEVDGVTWTFTGYPNYPDEENPTQDELANFRNIVTGPNTLQSVANMTMTMFGRLACKACNKIGCRAQVTEISIYDGEGPVSIDHQDPVVVGDDVTLRCIVTNSNYSNRISWKDPDGISVSDGKYIFRYTYSNQTRCWTFLAGDRDDRLSITMDNTKFSYISMLHIRNSSEFDNGFWKCVATGKYGGAEHADVKVVVQSPLLPSLNHTTLNKTKMEIMVPRDKLLWPLRCNATGRPTPLIKWYKDGTEINDDDIYDIKDRTKLRIKKLIPGTASRYSCRAENRIGMDEAWIDIHIKQFVDNQTIWLSIVGTLIFIVIIVITCLLMKVRRERVLRKDLLAAGLTHFQEGALECLNPDLTIDDQAELLPYDKKWEFPRERLKLGRQLGSGAFGVVMKAEARGLYENEDATTVAVKMVRRTAELSYIKALASELKIMIHLGKHLNVVNLLGACTENIGKRDLLVIVEYCRFGNLHNYLLRHRSDFVDQIDVNTGKIDWNIGVDRLNRSPVLRTNNGISASLAGSDSAGSEIVDYRNGSETVNISMSPDGCVLSNNSVQPGWRSNYRGDYKDQNLRPICTQDLICWAWQVARGMEYLSARKVLHGDLAARNILLADDNVVKICDFGLAKSMYKDDNYKKKGEGLLPVKWMAIESIRDRVFSTQSDVWSFGIVLWEFFTLAQTPYPGMETEKQYKALIEGYRLEQPEYAPNEIYDIMLNCWKGKPSLRPSFHDLAENIGSFLEDTVKLHYVDLNTPYMNSNHIALQNGQNDYLTMISAPDHESLSSPNQEYANVPSSVSSPPANSDYLAMNPLGKHGEAIFSPRIASDGDRFNFSTPVPTSPMQSDTDEPVESAPMLTKEDPYVQPIDVRQRRAEFARQRQSHATNPQPSRNEASYCNVRNNNLASLDKGNCENTQHESKTDEGVVKSTPGMIISSPDNYVNMPQQKSDRFIEKVEGFSNPSYVVMSNLQQNETCHV